MLRYDIPRERPPEHLVRAAREATTQEDKQVAREVLTAFCERVGFDRVDVPMKEQDKGPEALEQFYFAQCELRWGKTDAEELTDVRA